MSDSRLVDSDCFFMSCPELSEEECSLIRLDLKNDDCTKPDAAERWLFENMFARSASEHDFACLPGSFNSNACPSDFALSLSSCAGPAVETPANGSRPNRLS